ncbi:ankyrin unc44 [Colletotrichum tofieldiae]|nr:ankyrin unc44 [Colletotrichum tofieldiae]
MPALHALAHVSRFSNNVATPRLYRRTLNTDSAFKPAQHHGHVKTAQVLVRHGVNCAHPVEHSNGVTGLMIVAANGMLGLLDWLVRRQDADSNSNANSNTKSDTNSSSATVEERDDRGMRALNYFAVTSDAPNTRSMARQLISQGSVVRPGGGGRPRSAQVVAAHGA